MKKISIIRRNNNEIQRISSDIDDDSLEDKVVKMLAEGQIVVTKSHIEGWVRMVIPLYDLSTESSVMTFWKKIDLHKNIYKSKLGFGIDPKIVIQTLIQQKFKSLQPKPRLKMQGVKKSQNHTQSMEHER